MTAPTASEWDAQLIAALVAIAAGMPDKARPWWLQLSEIGWARQCSDGAWRVTPAGRLVLTVHRQVAAVQGLEA